MYDFHEILHTIRLQNCAHKTPFSQELLRKNHILLKQIIFTHISYISWPISVKLGTVYLTVITVNTALYLDK